jgi:uncharacterized membrane protein YeiB
MPAVEERRAGTGIESVSGRVLGFDVARSLALLGMFVVHFGLVLAGDRTRPAWAVAIMDTLDGRAAATFVVLAGVGLTLRATRANPGQDPLAISRARGVVARRGLILLIVGFANLLIWPGDILRVYGVSLLVASRFLEGSGRRLLLVATGFVLGFVVLIQALDYGKNWEWDTLTYHHLWTLEGTIRNLFYDGFRSVFPWTGLLFYGMWLGRLELKDRSVNARVVLVALWVVVSTEVASRLLLAHFRAHPGTMDAEEIQALFGTVSMPPLPLFLLTSGSAATLVIALCVRVTEATPNSTWARPLASTGQMAFTWYVAHILIGLGGVVASGLAATQSLPVGEAAGLLFFAAAVVISSFWKSRYRHGPLEWALRKLAG